MGEVGFNKFQASRLFSKLKN